MNTVSEIGAVISKLRKDRGVTQEELAKYVGVSAQAVSKWENGGVPDTELLPKIADYFKVSIDSLFERSFSDYSDLQNAIINKIKSVPMAERFNLVFDHCWDMERAFMADKHIIELNSISDYENDIKENEQHYSCILTDYGFTRMGIANRSQYFLIVPNAKDSEQAYFNGIDYPSFFRDFSEQDTFDALVMLNKREGFKAFTPNLFVKHLEITFERSMEILDTLRKYHLISTSQIEMDDEIKTVYRFNPTPSFVALLIFAREIIDRPEFFCYNYSGRRKPYL